MRAPTNGLPPFGISAHFRTTHIEYAESFGFDVNAIELCSDALRNPLPVGVPCRLPALLSTQNLMRRLSYAFSRS